MSVEKENQIKELENKIKVWELFLIEVSKLDNDYTVSRGLVNDRIVWTDNKLEFNDDPSTLRDIDKPIAKKAGIYKEYKFSVSNYSVRKGKAECEKQIGIEIDKLRFTIKSLTAK